MTDNFPSPRQTLSYLRNLLQQHRIDPKSKLGQNFLIDLNLIDLVVRSAELGPEDVVLEVGSGTGSLTARLALEAGGVVSVEIDPAFADLTAELIGEREGVTLLRQDALRTKNELSPALLEAVAQQLKRPGIKRLKLVANLPYSVATPVISNLLLTELPTERMVVTVQWEIAERLEARPDTAPYGALAVLVQSLAEVVVLRRLSPKVFWPRPKVESAIVLIRPDPVRRAQVQEAVGGVLTFRAFLRDLYVHRRKNLRGALVAMPGREWKKDEVDRRLAELGIAGTLRAEALDLEQHLSLCRAFRD